MQHPLVLKISKFISNFFNPLVSLLIYFVYASYATPDSDDNLWSLLRLFLILILPISAWIFWNVKTGRYTNMDVSNRKQRNSLYIVIVGLMLVYLLVDYFLNHKHINLEILFLLILLVLMQLSNYFIKTSMHTALNVYTAALFFAINPTLGFIWFGIAVLVGITRITLGRHSVKEVLMGFFLSSIVSFIYLYTSILMNAQP